jgi:hypothetical protein
MLPIAIVFAAFFVGVAFGYFIAALAAANKTPGSLADDGCIEVSFNRRRGVWEQ